MPEEFSYEWLKGEFEEASREQSEENRKRVLAKLVPSIFVTQGDRMDTFALEANGKWSKDKYPRELLPAIRAYKTALLKELREAEWYIQYLQEEGAYPLGRIQTNVTYKENEE